MRPPSNHPRSSRQRYLGFLKDYRQRRLDDPEESGEDQRPSDAPTNAAADAKSSEARTRRRGKRREYLGDYIRWLRPHRYGIIIMFV